LTKFTILLIAYEILLCIHQGTTDILSTISKPETVEELHRKRRKHLEVRQEDSQMEVLYPQKKQKVKEG
jgi:hypothetical protein